MSLYEELNNVRIDVSAYEEEMLTEIERKRWEKRVLRKLPKRRTPSMIKWVGLAGAMVLLASLIIPLSGTALAKMPLVYQLIESFIQVDHPPDLSNYKTTVGETAENAYGRMTLNEVLVDTDRLLISATLEPNKRINRFDLEVLKPTIFINGEEARDPYLTQSIGRENDGAYTITGDVPLNTLPHFPKGDQLQFKISYNSVRKDEKVVIDKPWVFDVRVSTKQMQKDTVTYEINKPLPLKHGGTVTINKVVSSPVSTTLYYDVSQAKIGSFWIRLVSKGGKIKELQFYESKISGERTYHRYGPLDLKKETYWIVAEDKNGKEISPRVPIK
ncbi:DUF4179 domain-containing protein [Paenibacillus zeisoli]|uniref:DUF4179 domain-containing protein n=1 Tax=Paenibacillus zeisoli TaxID=2496267 RepID=A0A433XCJ7_9BACL|nr:DUF4179 domain-containing protein [Paenibacillus zeisoli]RUT31881.1 DUF4179 domain-containing protein [Paenibacillus zeisoli]